MIRLKLVTLTLALVVCTTSAHALSRQEMLKVLQTPMVNGGMLYKQYCITCHGADGRKNMVVRSDRGKELSRFTKAVNSKHLARSSNGPRPFWDKKLNQQEIRNLATYLKSATVDHKRGEVVFKSNCIQCHGLNGDGKGRAARFFNPPPADLTTSDKNQDYKEMIVRLGGKAMGRSDIMPAWGKQLSEQEIKDVVQYLQKLLRKR